MIAVPSNATSGPVLLTGSFAARAARRGIRVPSLQSEIVIVRELAASSTPGSNAQPVEVPAFEKSAAEMPVTFSEKVTVYVCVNAWLNGSEVVVNASTDGGDVSVTATL